MKQMTLSHMFDICTLIMYLDYEFNISLVEHFGTKIKCKSLEKKLSIRISFL